MSEQLWMTCKHGKPYGHLLDDKKDWTVFTPESCLGGHPVEGERVWWCEDCKTATPTVTAIHRIHHADSLVERFLIPLPNPEGEE